MGKSEWCVSFFVGYRNPWILLPGPQLLHVYLKEVKIKSLIKKLLL